MNRLQRPALLISIATAFSLLGDQFLYAVLPSVYDELGLLPIHVGVLLSVNRWVRFVTNPLAERAYRKYQPGPLLTAALLLGGLLTVAYGTIHTFAVLLVARLLWGLCWSFIRQAGIVTVVESAGTVHLGRHMGFYNGISRCGSLFGMLLGGIGHDQIGWPATLLAFAVISIAAAPLGLSARGVNKPIQSRETNIASPRNRNRGLLISGAIIGLVGSGMIMSTLGFFLETRVGAAWDLPWFSVEVASLTGIVLACRWVIALIGAPTMGTISDRIGRKASAIALFGLGGVTFLALVPTTGVTVLILGILATFVCTAGLHVIMTAEAGARGPRVVMAFVTAFDMGSATGPMVAWGALQWGFPRHLILLGAGIAYLSGVMAVMAAYGRREMISENPIRV
jgi:MFS family permease